MSRVFPILSGLFATLWSQALLVASLVLLLGPGFAGERPIPGLMMIAAGYCVAMWLVIDRLVPDAGPVLVVPLKLAAAATFSVCAGFMAYSLATGHPPPLPLIR